MPGMPAPEAEIVLAPGHSFAVGALLTAYFAWFSRTAWRTHFSGDDLMNLHYYWSLPPWQQVFGPLILWRPLYRPMAAWFLLPILRGFGMNPAAFHAMLFAVLLATAFLMYRLSLLLQSGEPAAVLVGLIACYHAGLSNLYYNVGFFYDALCGFFFVAALLYYVSIRRRGSIPGWKQTVVFLSLFLAALDSKEMAATLPAILLFYECFYHEPWQLWRRSLVQWSRGPGRCVVAGACLTLVFLYGRVVGTGGLMHNSGYGPKLSMARIWDFQVRSFGDLFEKWQYFGRPEVVVLWIAMFYIAWRRPRPVLRFACLCLLITPLPVEVLIGRGQGCLYIPMLAWSLFVSVFFVDVADRAAAFLAGEPGFRRLRRIWLAAALVAAGALFWAHRNSDLKRSLVDPISADFMPQIWKTIQQFEAFHLRVRPHSTMVFVNDPFGSWDMYFIADLTIRDRTLNISLNRKTPLTPEEVAKADYLFDYRDGRLVRVR
jgi:hypothetical protein